MAVVLQGYLRCETAEQAETVAAHLDEHIRKSRAEPGCVSFDVTPTDDPLIWHVSETFTDAASFQAHQARGAASDWARHTAGIARDYTVTGLE